MIGKSKTEFDMRLAEFIEQFDIKETQPMSDTLPEREDQMVSRDFDRCQYDYGGGVRCCTFRNCHGPYMNHRFVEADYCDECKGRPHAPWCSLYEQPKQCERCTSIATTTVRTRHFGLEKLCEPCAVNVRRDGQEVAVEHQPAARGGGEGSRRYLLSEIQHLINENESLVAERERLLELLRQVTSATKCYCVTLESGKCWQCQAREVIKQRSTSE